MPKKIFNFEKYASYDEIANKSICLIETCKKELSGKLKSNIKRHYRLVHKQDIESDNESDSGEDVYKKRKLNKTIKLKTTMDKDNFLKCCVGLVTKKSIPVGIFDDQECFKQLIAPYEQQFNINLNSSNIGIILEEASGCIKAEISALIKNKMICLKIDTASRMERNVLGINIQYIKDFKICMNTIGMVEITKHHTAANLKEEILKCLKEYNIEMRQIYSTTTDNGANVLKVSRLLQEIQQENIKEEFIDCAESRQIEPNLESILRIVQCPAHAIQLAANDVIKTLTTEIEECRKIAEHLRTSLISANDEITLPCLDETRWNSTYDMLNKILSLKEYIENLDSLRSIFDINWSFIQNFIMAFAPLEKCTMNLQTEKYILGDFFRDWLTCELELEALVNINTYAAALLSAMRTRKETLLKHDVFAAAIYLDPRFNFSFSPFLTNDLMRSAMDHLLAVHEMVNKLTNNSTKQTNLDYYNLQSFTFQENTPASTSNPYNILDHHVQSLMCSQNLSSPTYDVNVKQKLLKLCERERTSFNTNVLEYWNKSWDNDKDMRQIVETVLAVPATQVSVERSFSALSTILTNLKSKLFKNSLYNLLIIKLNYELLNYSNIDIENSIIANDFDSVNE